MSAVKGGEQIHGVSATTPVPPAPSEKDAAGSAVAHPDTPVESSADGADSPDPSAILWRTTLQVAIRFRETPPELAAELWLGLRGRLWARLTKPDGTKYKQFQEFCEAPQPHGLGTAHTLVNRLLVEIGNAREVKLLTVAPGCQGQHAELPITSRHNGGKPSSRTTERLRAIAERSPESIQRLYTAGVIDQIDAEPFGRRQPSPERQDQIADFVNRVAAPLARRIEDGWTPPPGERRELRRQVKSEIGVVFAIHRRRDPPSADDAAGAPGGLGVPSDPLRLVPSLALAPGAERWPLSAEQAAELSVAELIRCHWMIVRELFGKRLAGLPTERWIDDELHPKILCRRVSDGELRLRQTIDRIELALQAVAQAVPPSSLQPVQGAAAARGAPVARIGTRPPSPSAKRGAASSS